MKKKETLSDLLLAEMCKASALWSIQENIEKGDYERAMYFQFGYLYWFDESARLQVEFRDEWWNLCVIAHGG